MPRLGSVVEQIDAVTYSDSEGIVGRLI
jgi:hypothetical protein